MSAPAYRDPALALPRQTAQPAGYYVVRSGDTLSGIARRLGVDMDALARANGIPLPYVIRVGQQLRVPSGAPAYRPPVRTPVPAPEPPPVRTPAPAPRPAPSPAPSPVPTWTPPPSNAPGPQPLARAREADAPRLTWPTDGALASRFGDLVGGLPNNGIDLHAFAGMAVRSSAAGTVVFAGKEQERFGNTVIIDHGDGWMTVYAYLGQLTVSVGEKVRQRTRIAFVGKSGAALHPTVHFELRHNNVPRDPELYLPQRL
ncbi:MAG: M23 family metallopeptidase [Sphingomonadales bacterium]|nr:M23 family metallopeptidase [Sphingomonadales bacterium]MDE2570501.1 M23 family metallopeptidase [Sphingomonadales bacterium]